MGRWDYLAMKTDDHVTKELLNSDFNELKFAAKRLINDATKLGGLGFGTSFLKWVASFAAMWVFSSYQKSWCLLLSLAVELICDWKCLIFGAVDSSTYCIDC